MASDDRIAARASRANTSGRLPDRVQRVVEENSAGLAFTNLMLHAERLALCGNEDPDAVEDKLARFWSCRTDAHAQRRRVRDDIAGVARQESTDGDYRGILPTVNSIAATGLAFLPGMMTGQILAVADPAEAVRYQLL